MEKILNRYGLGPRILALAALPLVIAIIFAINSAYEARSVANQAEKLDALARYAPFVSGVIHELQKERGASAGYIGSGGGSERKQAMEGQRKTTDSAFAAFTKADMGFDHEVYGIDFVNRVNVAKAELAKLADVRRETSALERTVPQMAGYYGGTIARLLDIIKNAALLSTDIETTQKITAYIGFLEAKERAGQERAIGAGGYSRGQFGEAALTRFAQLIEAQKSFLSMFDTFATAETKRYYGSTVRGSSVDNVQQMRDNVFAKQGNVADTGFTGKFWFDEITKKINLLKQVEDHMNLEIREATNELASSASFVFWLLLIAILVGSGFVGFISFAVYRSVAHPLRGIEGAMQGLVSGDYAIDVPYTDYDSSIGKMAKAVFAFKENGIKAKQLAEEAKVQEENQKAAEEARKREEDERQEQERQREMAEMQQREGRTKAIEDLTQKFDAQVGAAMDQLNNAILGLGDTATQLTVQADSTENESSSASSAADQTSANVQTVASAAEELSSSISEISRQVSQSNEISQTAVDEVGNASKAVEELAQTSQKIGDVVNLINDIAGQTNLLALNATIEAARAGEAGKGFAVVASEVKALANQTAQATNDIATQVNAMRDVSSNVSHAVELISGVITQTSQISSSVAAAVEEQGAATSEISRNVQEASEGTLRVSGNVQSVLHGASSTKAAASDIQSSSSNLANHGAELKTLIDSFLSEVRSV
jgi:methyl-accepting chemotaxis protein